MNCDVVTASRYAEFFLGIPIASLGAGWFLALFAVSLIALNRFWRREALRAAFALSALGTLISLAYLGIMATQIKTFCLFCIAIDVVNIAALGVVVSMKPEGFSKHPLNRQQWKTLLPTVGASLLIAVLVLKAFEGPTFGETEVNEAALSLLNSPQVAVKTDESFSSIGPKNAKITIVEFSDFQCPFCRVAAFAINSMLNKYPDQVRVVFRNYPLDQACNREVQQSAHAYACEAARVAYCAHKLGNFQEVYEGLFDQQASFGPGRPMEIAQAAGTQGDLKTCVESAEATQAVSQDIEEAITLGVKSTPTFFLNGHKIEGAMPAVVWDRMIELILKGKNQ
jgi:protein-disulfide isomerase